jgi:hypothetical protein
MDYQKIYEQIINRAQNRMIDGYKERHHIIPKCMGGANTKENLVKLTAREHFICHWLLIRIYPSSQKLTHSFWMMCAKKSKRHQYYTPSSRMYSEAKEMYSKNGLSEDVKQKLRKPKPAGFGEKIRKANLGKKHTLEHIKSNSQGQLVRINLVGHGHNKGTKWSKTSKEKFAESRKGINNPAYGRKLSNEHKFKFKKPKRKIIQLSMEGNILQEWESSKMIYESLGFSQDQIIAVCKGRRTSFKNYIWEYATS